MDDRLVRLESTIEQLQTAVHSLQARVDELESYRRSVATEVTPADNRARSPASTSAAPMGTAGREGFDPIVVLSLLGRLFLVLAGGFFLRAMTEAGVLAASAGVASAFAYGLGWLLMADRAGRLQQPLSAIFHALGAALVVYPLITEATSRFHVLGGSSSALVLAALTSGFLIVAWHRRLIAIAWVTVVAALPTSAVLLLKTGADAPFAVFLIGLGLATLWLAYAVGWTWLRWPVALVADLAVVGVTMRALGGHHGTATVVVLIQLLLLGAYLGSAAIHTLVRHRSVTMFDAVQAAAVLVVGFGGAVYLTRAHGAVAPTLGAIALLLGGACYFVASRLLQPHDRHANNLYFYTSLALVFTLAGTTLELPAVALAVVFSVFAAVAAGAWSRYGRLYMLLHAAAYVVVAGVASGALIYAARALAASPAGPWALPEVAILVVTVAAAVCAWLAARRPDPDGGVLAKALRLVIAVVVVVVASGVLTGYVAAAAAGLPDGTVNVGVLATVRTGVLAAATLFVAWLGSHASYREWAWLVYPMLIAIGLKMVAQDFKHSRPATLFIALAFYGAALILAPRLKRAARLIPRHARVDGAVGLSGT
ncbi:MAG TPA: hypothetical protein VFI92_15650 [Steroidobacteraceae bacterium]|nr:hypothetical protein [Steroidobacteraceae bacterium]